MFQRDRLVRSTLIGTLLTGVVLVATARCALSLSPRPGAFDQPAPGSTSLAGRVVNGITGAPLPRVLVQAGSQAMLTDRNGQFQIGVPGQVPTSLQVTKPGYGLSPEQLDDFSFNLNGISDRTSMEVSLYPEGVISGIVATAAGTPLPNVLVTVRRIVFTESGPTILQAARVKTDFLGGFRAPVPAGHYLVEVEAERAPFDVDQIIYPEILPNESEGFTSGLSLGSGEELRVTLSPHVLRGYNVSLAPGPAGEGALRIVARSKNGLLLPLGSGRNGGENRARLTLPNGTYTLEATSFGPTGERMGQTTVTITDHDLSGVVVPMSPVPQIPIELTAQSSDAAGAQAASTTPPSAQQMSLSLVRTPADPEPSAAAILQRTPEGTWIFRTPPGRYRLHASGDSAWYATSATYGESNLLQGDLIIGPAVGAATVRLQVSDQTGSLNGAVRLSGTPASCWIYLITTDPTLAPITLHHSTTDGTFTFAHVPPGEYRVVAFEHKHSANLLDSKVLGAFGARVASVSIRSAERSSVTLDAVPTRELLLP